MGSSSEETSRDAAAVTNVIERSYARSYMAAEHPQHTVHIGQSFALARYPVTRGEFAVFVQETGYPTIGGCSVSVLSLYRRLPDATWRNPSFFQSDRDPVVCVNWQDVQAYILWLNKQSRSSATENGGGLYRLPGESEWQYAARAGQRTARWWGNDIEWNNAVCNGCGSKWDNNRTAPVGSFRPNGFGLYDMLGNVWQWTADCWNASYYGVPLDGRSWLNGDCDKRVQRGGAWNGASWTIRSATRTGANVNTRINERGFRVAKTLPDVLGGEQRD